MTQAGGGELVFISDITLDTDGTATITPKYTKTKDSDENWTFTTETENIVSIDGFTVTAQRIGQTKVNGTDSKGRTASFTVYVREKVAGTAFISDAVLDVGGTSTIKPSYSNPNEADDNWTFTTETENIVNIDGFTVTAQRIGQTKVNGTDSKGRTASFTVYVREKVVTKSENIFAFQTISLMEGYTYSSLTPSTIECDGNIVTSIGTEDGAVVGTNSADEIAIIYMFNVNDKLPLGLSAHNYNGDTITNFAKNKMAFTVSAQEGAAIKIDDKDYTNTGIHEYGTYKVNVSKDTESYTFAINLLQAEADKGNTYDIVATYATLPTLLTALDIVKNENEKFIWFGRSGTLSVDILGNDDKVTLSNHIGVTSVLATSVVQEIKDYCYDKLATDSNAKFNLYVDDFRHWIEITTLAEIGLNSNRYNVYYCSDGTYSYTKAYSYKSGTIDNYNTVDEARKSMVENARSNAYASDTTDQYMNSGSYTQMDFRDDFIICGATLENIHYWVQYPNYIKASSPEVQAKFAEAFDEKLPEIMYAELTDEQKQAFLSLVNFDKTSFDATYFNEDNDKPYLIVTGTNPFNDTTLSYINKVYAEYSTEYNIVFKPHPSAIPYGTHAEALSAMNIKVLPGRLPMEVILFVYPDYKTGGYNSSLYMAAPKGNTLFFFANSKDSLSSPIKDLYDELFSNAVFITLP